MVWFCDEWNRHGIAKRSIDKQRKSAGLPWNSIAPRSAGTAVTSIGNAVNRITSHGEGRAEHGDARKGSGKVWFGMATALSGLERSSKGIASMRIATELGSQDVHGNSKEWNRDGMAKSRAALAKLGCE